MRPWGLPLAAALLAAACGGADNGPASAPDNAIRSPGAPAAGSSEAPAAPSDVSQPVSAARWDLQSSGEGVALARVAADGSSAIRLFCPTGENRLLVNVPAFRPIGSEERLSFGSGGNVVALVADTRGDAKRGGVSGTGEVPDDLERLVGGPISASYGAQISGPHPAPPEDLSRAFVGACDEGAAPTRPAPSASPCLVQDGENLRLTPLRAVGTEPFWAARIEGRCVIYSHPEDQDGTRVWTRFTPGPEGGLWVGALGGHRFELRTRSQPGCSDGMSDTRYPMAVELEVHGERRRGCAAPL